MTDTTWSGLRRTLADAAPARRRGQRPSMAELIGWLAAHGRAAELREMIGTESGRASCCRSTRSWASPGSARSLWLLAAEYAIAAHPGARDPVEQAAASARKDPPRLGGVWLGGVWLGIV